MSRRRRVLSFAASAPDHLGKLESAMGSTAAATAVARPFSVFFKGFSSRTLATIKNVRIVAFVFHVRHSGGFPPHVAGPLQPLTLYSACCYGRRHATLTAAASVAVIGLMMPSNPGMFSHQMSWFLLDEKWYDLMIWGSVLTIQCLCDRRVVRARVGAYSRAPADLSWRADGPAAVHCQRQVHSEPFVPCFDLCS